MKTAIAMLTVCLGLAGCASAPVDYYRLDAPGPASLAVPGRLSLQIGPVTVPPWLDRPQLVLDDGSGRVRVLDQSRWAAPLPRMISAALAHALGRSLPGVQVDAWPRAAAASADWVVLLDIRALQARPGVGVHLEAAWRVLHDGQDSGAGDFVQDAPAGSDITSLVAAHDALLAALAERLGASLRSQLR